MPTQRITDRFDRVRAEKRAALVTYVMAGDPDRELSAADLRSAPDRLMSLAATPAERWVVIHGHRMARQVRETLRAVAVRPHTPRRYCLVDGAQVFRILKSHRRI